MVEPAPPPLHGTASGAARLSGLLAAMVRTLELQDAGTARRSLPMEGLRGLAVLLVFFVHYTTLVEPWLRNAAADLFQDIHRLGNTGVDLFFVLSGYLIYGTLIRKDTPFLAFMGRRIQRLYPAFIAVLVLYLLLSALFPAESKLPRDLGEAALYVLQNLLLLPGIFDIPPIITVAWSLSYEMLFYLVVPLLVDALRLRRWPVAWRTALFLLAAAAFVVPGFPYPRMAMFACGMILADILPRLRGRAGIVPWLDLGAVAAVLACGAALARGLGGTLDLVVLFVACFALCAAALLDAGVVARALAYRPLRLLGNMSYSYYLLHGLALKFFFLCLRPFEGMIPASDLHYLILLPPAFLGTVLASYGLYLAVERPLSLLPAMRQGRLAPQAQG